MNNSENSKKEYCNKEAINLARNIIKMRDPYTASHQNHVGELAKKIAAKMGLDEGHQDALLVAGYLHDIGKIVVPVSILTKPGKLSPQEYRLIQNHVQAGFDLLKEVNFPADVARTVLEHHERLDGSGYPNKLMAEQISIDAKILSIADVFLSMAGSRPYRAGLGIEAAIAELEGGRGLIYDESAIDAFLTLIRQNEYELPTTL